ncbi:MAG: DUF4430 domain-containing protein [Clostridiales bacterium]|nr:DUF4430 domain-containing protein [Clostridiales bacterium]
MRKNKIIAAAVIFIVLMFAFWWGGGAPGLHSENRQIGESINMKKAPAHTKKPTPSASPTEAVKEETSESKSPDNTPASTAEKKEPNPPSKDEDYREEKGAQSVWENNSDYSGEKDEYRTDPVPEGMPVPVEPEETVISDKELTCTMSIRCDTILKNLPWLNKAKADIVPPDGVIYAEQTVTFYEGESVFNVLVREMKRNKIHLEFENTPIYNSAYIEGIANLYEFDCGELSGWMYKVNGWFPNYGCSRYLLKDGDRIEWVYTCDLGADVGGGYSAGNGR